MNTDTKELANDIVLFMATNPDASPTIHRIIREQQQVIKELHARARDLLDYQILDYNYHGEPTEEYKELAASIERLEASLTLAAPLVKGYDV